MENEQRSKKKSKKLRDVSRIIVNKEVDEQDIDAAPNMPDEKPSVKRPLDDDEANSENEDKPKKKKKRNKIACVEGLEKKGKKSIRQQKREKHLQRQAEAQAASQETLKSQCLSYLSQWKHNKQNWKFMKAKQIWLAKNKFSEKLIPDKSWPVLLEYFESAKGNIRNMLLEDANKVIKQMDEWIESQNKGTNENDDLESNPDSNKPSQTSYNRARDLIQSLQ